MLAQHADETGQAFTDDAQRLILRRDTHIDDLANKRREERVRRVIEPILAGRRRNRVLGRGSVLRP